MRVWGLEGFWDILLGVSHFSVLAMRVLVSRGPYNSWSNEGFRKLGYPDLAVPAIRTCNKDEYVVVFMRV